MMTKHPVKTELIFSGKNQIKMSKEELECGVRSSLQRISTTK